MTRKTWQGRPDDAQTVWPDESFLQRFHRRKTEARHNVVAPAHPAEDAPLPDTPIDGLPAQPEPTDADMPPLESLDATSDYSGFLSSKVSETLRRAALRKLFHSGAFNVPDGLDDYAEDFTAFSALGEVVTADMRHRLATEARRRAEALGESLVDGEQPEARAGQVEAEAAAAEGPASDEGGGESPPTTQTT